VRFGEDTVPQLRALRAIGLLREGRPDDEAGENAAHGGHVTAAPPRPLVAADDPSLPVEDRARAYLHVNCGHCHRFGGGGMAAIQLNREVPLEASRAVDVAPGQGDFGITDARIIAPGDPSRSTLVYRLASAGAGHMPPIGTSLVDHDGVTLIHDWVRTLGPASGPRPDIERLAGGVGRPAVAGSMADSHDDDATIRSLLASMPAALELAHMVREGRLPAAPRAAVLAAAAAWPEPSVVAVFEPFLPPGSVAPRLGTAIDPDTILLRVGDPARGRTLYHDSASLQCRSCHLLEKTGREIGPSLADVGRPLDHRQILEAILKPSRLIAPEYRTWVVQTCDGRLFTGLVVSRSADGIVLRDLKGRDVFLASEDIEEAVPQAVSLMPEHTLRDLSAQQAADLLAYLTGCQGEQP
jgi:putative heme-binding domain-containing protein